MASPCGGAVGGGEWYTSKDKQGHHQAPRYGILVIVVHFFEPSTRKPLTWTPGQEMGNSLLRNPQAGQCRLAGIRPTRKYT